MLGAHVACLVVWYFHDNPRQCVLDVLQPVDVCGWRANQYGVSVVKSWPDERTGNGFLPHRQWGCDVCVVERAACAGETKSKSFSYSFLKSECWWCYLDSVLKSPLFDDTVVFGRFTLYFYVKGVGMYISRVNMQNSYTNTKLMYQHITTFFGRRMCVLTY